MKAKSGEAPHVVLHRRGAERCQRGHPWIYASDLQAAAGLQGGEVVRVLDQRRRFLGQALYSKQSKIALRWLTDQDVPVDAAFWRARIHQALALRQLIYPGERTYRAVHGDADLLPGLIVDRYEDYLVAQFLVKGTDDRKELLADLLVEAFEAKGLMNRSDASVRSLEGLSAIREVMRGQIPVKVEYRVGTLRLWADLQQGQKTGAFLDQRENQLVCATYARGAALDCFAYAGGFALQLATRATQVTAVESSEPAAQQLKANCELNQLTNVQVVIANAFDFLRDAVDEGRSFDTVVLDPPSFARNKASIDAALRGYKEINLRAMQLLQPSGFLITCSCSHHVSEDRFEQVLAAAAADAKRRFQIVDRRGASRDHPVLLSLPETRYLKCFVLRAL